MQISPYISSAEGIAQQATEVTVRQLEFLCDYVVLAVKMFPLSSLWNLKATLKFFNSFSLAVQPCFRTLRIGAKMRSEHQSTGVTSWSSGLEEKL